MKLKHFLLTALCVVATVGAKAGNHRSTWSSINSNTFTDSQGLTLTVSGSKTTFSNGINIEKNNTATINITLPNTKDIIIYGITINSKSAGNSGGTEFSTNLNTNSVEFKVDNPSDFSFDYNNYLKGNLTAIYVRSKNRSTWGNTTVISSITITYALLDSETDMTFAIVNPGAETNDGWTFDEGGRYLESSIAHGGSRVFETAGWWSYTTRSVRQTVTNIPNGYYTLSTWRMAGTNATCTLTGNDASATSIGTGDQGDDKWQKMSVITKVTDGNLQIEASSNSPSGVDEKTTWANFDDFSLSYLGNASASMAVNAAAKYGTFCAPFAVTVPSGVEASTATLNGNGSTIDLTPVGETIPANTPVILYAENGLDATTLYGAAVAGTPTEGNLTGVYTATMAQDGWYVLQNNDNKVGFYRVHSGSAHPTVGANRCYLTTSGKEARAFFFDEETAISAIEALTTGTAEIYSLDGTKTSILRKGVNIIRLTNGKTQKVIVK